MTETGTEYINYQHMITTVSTALSDMMKLCDQMKLEENKKELLRIEEKLSHHTFSVGIMGEFKRGKSTVINSLLEREIMPADILPCSATMNRVTYDLHPHVQLRMRDGSTREIPVEELSSYVTKLDEASESRAAEVDEAIVFYPCRFCKNGVDIVDTPGLNDDERMNRISEEVIPKLDAVIMVLTPDNPFSMSEAEFVRNKLMVSDLGRLVFVVNKIDTIRRAADRQRVVDGIRSKIQESVMQKMANLYGKGSAEYEEAVRKMGKIRVFPLSALDALDGKMEGDQALIEKSGTVEFEAALTKMLTEERGALELSAALSALARTAVELAKTIALRKQALDLSAKEFEESRAAALEEISKIRIEKKEETKHLRESARTTKLQLKQDIANFYPTLRTALKGRLDDAAAQIDPAQLTSDSGLKATAEQLQGVVSAECQDQLSLISEQIMDRLDRQVGKELARAGSFVSDAAKKLDVVNTKLFKRSKGLDGADIVATGIEAFVGSSFMGIGGIVAGYKNAGIKGALVGGGVGFGATLVAAAIMVEMALFGPIAVLACALTGTMAGKFATAFLFRKDIGKKKLEEIKTAIHDSIDSLVLEMQQRHELEDWCEQRVQQRFDELVAGLDEETERLLKSTENSIDEIKQDITENEMQRKQLSQRFDKMLEDIRQITEADIAPVTARVKHVLENA